MYRLKRYNSNLVTDRSAGIKLDEDHCSRLYLCLASKHQIIKDADTKSKYLRQTMGHSNQKCKETSGEKDQN